MTKRAREHNDLDILAVQLDEGAYKPTRGHMDDAGFDLYSPVDAEVKAHDSVIINTGVHVKIPAGCAGLIVAKSGLNTKHDLTATGLIDRGYTGSIRVKLYNNGDHDYSISNGDKITQLVIVNVWMPKYDKDATVVDDIGESSDGRGDNGFGSTGK